MNNEVMTKLLIHCVKQLVICQTLFVLSCEAKEKILQVLFQ